MDPRFHGGDDCYTQKSAPSFPRTSSRCSGNPWLGAMPVRLGVVFNKHCLQKMNVILAKRGSRVVFPPLSPLRCLPFVVYPCCLPTDAGGIHGSAPQGDPKGRTVVAEMDTQKTNVLRLPWYQPTSGSPLARG